ncbi:MAG TPA: ABC-F family ATP-binding cassette domain-containing protein [Oscillospiraceae bacterium]|nr:ABC-F family ATP-binding cassette domain-containing protein [Oscillospiraceae bacterium]
MIVDLAGIGRSFGAREVLRDITFRIEDGDRIGLIGENGAGKSTLLNIIIGDLEPDHGTIFRAEGKKIGFLRQDSGLIGENTILEELKRVFEHEYAVESAMREHEHAIAAVEHDSAEYHRLATEYEMLKNEYESAGGYQIDVKIRTILTGMGFSEFDPETKAASLSGGERTRLALARLLLEEPDLLMLDEPTNHLDFHMLEWLEDYLSGYKGAILAVSHDRYFLDKTVKTVFEMENKTVVRYSAGYTGYLDLRDARIARQQKEYDRQMREIASLEDFIAKNKARASTTNRAQSREKELDRMERLERPVPPEKPPKFSFPFERDPVKDVLIVEGLELSVDAGDEEKILCPEIDLTIRRGEKVAIVGRNGVGKSTLLKTLQGILPNKKGIVEWGRNVKIGYYDQNNATLHEEKTMLEELWDRYPRSDELTLRSALGHVRLTGENVFKRIAVLSGGERARLSFAALSLSGANVLVLDEPTNHMDIPCKEALEQALREYPGTILMVSHDRYLLNHVPTRIIEMFPDAMVSYDGVYDDYLVKRQGTEPSQKAKREQNPSENQAAFYKTKQQKSEDAKRRTAIKRAEEAIAAADQRLAEIDSLMAQPEIAADYLRMSELCAEMEELKSSQSAWIDEWAAWMEEET